MLNLSNFQKEHLKNRESMLLFPVESISIKCPVCHTGTLNNNLSCNSEYCREKHTVPFTRGGFPSFIEGYSVKSVKVTRLNNISVYDLENIGIESASGSVTSAELQDVFSDFKNWYNNEYTDYKDNHFAFIVEVESSGGLNENC